MLSPKKVALCGCWTVVIRPLLAGNKPVLAQWDSVKRAAGGFNVATPVPVPAPVPTAAPANAAAGPARPEAAAA